MREESELVKIPHLVLLLSIDLDEFIRPSGIMKLSVKAFGHYAATEESTKSDMKKGHLHDVEYLNTEIVGGGCPVLNATPQEYGHPVEFRSNHPDFLNHYSGSGRGFFFSGELHGSIGLYNEIFLMLCQHFAPMLKLKNTVRFDFKQHDQDTSAPPIFKNSIPAQVYRGFCTPGIDGNGIIGLAQDPPVNCSQEQVLQEIIGSLLAKMAQHGSVMQEQRRQFLSNMLGIKP